MVFGIIQPILEEYCLLGQTKRKMKSKRKRDDSCQRGSIVRSARIPVENPMNTKPMRLLSRLPKAILNFIISFLQLPSLMFLYVETEVGNDFLCRLNDEKTLIDMYYVPNEDPNEKVLFARNLTQLQIYQLFHSSLSFEKSGVLVKKVCWFPTLDNKVIWVGLQAGLSQLGTMRCDKEEDRLKKIKDQQIKQEKERNCLLELLK